MNVTKAKITMRAMSKSQLAALAGAPPRTFARWLSHHQEALSAMGVSPKQRLLPPCAVKYLCEVLAIDLPEPRRITKTRP